MKLRSLLLAGILLAGYATDKEFYQERIDRDSNIEVRLKTVTKVAMEEEPKTFDQSGYGFVVGKYIYSREHVTSKASLSGWPFLR